MKRLKRLMSAVLVLVMVMTMLPVPFAAAAEPEELPEALQSLHPFEGTEALIRDAAASLQNAGEIMEEKEEDADLADSVADASAQTLAEVKTTLADRLLEALDEGVMDVADLGLSEELMDRVMEELLYDRYLYNALSDIAYTAENGVVTEVSFTASEGYRSAMQGLFEDYVQPEVGAEDVELPEQTVSVMAESGDQAACARHTAENGVQFNWVLKEDYTPVMDKDNNVLNGGLLYDAKNKTILQGILPEIYWQLESVTYHCAVCGQDIVINDPQMLSQMLTTYEVYVDPAKYNPQTGEGMIKVPTSEKQPTDPKLIHATQVAVAQFVDDSFNPTSPEMGPNGMPKGLYIDNRDNGASKVAWYYNMLSAFFADHAEYYGVAGDYWTSMNSEANPMAALKALCNMDPSIDVPPMIMGQLVQMLPQAFMAYVYFYGNELLAMRDQAMALVDALPARATDVQKLLVLHDWLAENAVFDMGAMVNVSASGGAPETDPIQMTPFGAILSNQLSTISGSDYYGCICLGYASAYSYLIQNAFPEIYKNKDGSWRTPAEVDANGGDIVDFGQVMFYADTAQTSIAGEGFGGGFFNNVHYFNLVRVKNAPTSMAKGDKMTGDWFFVDSCYDDIFVECLSQYRGEADGSVHHDYFLVSPQTMDKVWHPNIDYISHLHDGYVYKMRLDSRGNPITFPKGDRRYNPLDPYHPQYEKVPAENETFNDNTCYEQSWFSGAVSKVYNDGKNWYYVDAEDSSLTFADKLDENGELTNDRDEVKENDIDVKKVMHSRRVDKKQQDKLKSRPMTSPDYWVGGEGTGMMPKFKKDPNAKVIFDYGTGKFASGGMDLSAAVQQDFTNNEQFPGLTHSLGMWNNELYFNLNNQIYAYGLKSKDCRLVKEYHDVAGVSDGRAFTATSYTVAQDGQKADLQVKDNPIAGLIITQRYTPLYNYLDANGQVVISYDGKLGEGYTSMEQAMAAVVGRQFVMMLPTPMMTVNVGTNYTFTAAFTDKMSDEEKAASRYTKEAINFNPEYAQQLEPLLSEGERESNTNGEFLWCANIREDIPAQMLPTMNTEAQANVCADGHDFVYNKAEKAYICRDCHLHATNITRGSDVAAITLTAKAESGMGDMQMGDEFVNPVSTLREAETKEYGQILVDVKPQKGSGLAATAVTYVSAADGKNAITTVVSETNNKGQFVIDKPAEAGCIEISAVYGDLHNVYVPTTKNGVIIPTPAKAPAGETVTLLGIPSENYAVQRPEVTYEEMHNGRTETVNVPVKEVPLLKNSFSFVMPDSDVTVKATFVPNDRPDAPEAKITVNQNTGKPYLTWEPVEGADSYEVWRSVEGGKYSRLYTTTGTRMTNSSAVPGTTYSYKVRAMSSNLAGAYSEVVEATCICARTEARVSLRTDGKPVVTWDKVDGAVKYEVYCAKGDGDFVRLFTTTGNRMNHTSAEVGQTYSYRVRAVCSDIKGNSAFSNTVEATCGEARLAIPDVKLTVKASSGKPYLTWNKVDGAAKYEVYRKVGKNGSYQKFYTTSGTRMTNSSAEPGTTYYYKVRAIAGDTKSKFSDVKYVTCDCAQPDVRLTIRSDGKPILRWNKVDGAVKYEVYRSVNGGDYNLLYTTSGTKMTNTSARSGQLYSYKVRALCNNSYGTGAFSDPVNVRVK